MVQRAQTAVDERTLSWVDSLLSRAVESDAKEQRKRVEQALRTFARNLTYSLHVPGSHPGGIAYDDLLDVLASQGRDFTADSTKLRDYVERGLLAEFAGDTTPPSASERRQIAAALVLRWILNRLESQLRDVPIKSNDATYRAWKRKHARYSAPGMRSGALRDAIKRHGEVTVR